MFGKGDRYWARELARREAAWAAERRELLDRIMLLAGNPWALPPREPGLPPPEPENDVVYAETLVES